MSSPIGHIHKQIYNILVNEQLIHIYFENTFFHIKMFWLINILQIYVFYTSLFFYLPYKSGENIFESCLNSFRFYFHSMLLIFISLIVCLFQLIIILPMTSSQFKLWLSFYPTSKPWTYLLFSSLNCSNFKILVFDDTQKKKSILMLKYIEILLDLKVWTKWV